MLGTLPLSLRPSGAIPQGQPRLDPNDLYTANTRSRWLLGSNIAFDLAGHNSGVLSGGAKIVPGLNGNEIDFNSSGRNVTLNKIQPIFAPPFTAIVYAKCTAVPATSEFSGLLGFPGASFKLSIGVGNDVSGSTVFGTWNGTAIEYDANTGLTVTAGMRFVVALVAITTTLSLLMFDPTNGLRIWSLSETIGSIDLGGGAINWVLGSDSFSGARFWPGTLSQVILLNNTALSVPQFMSLAQKPFQGLIFPSDFNIGMFGRASTPVASPFFVPNFDLRPNIKINPDLRLFTDDRVINLIGSDSIYSGPGQAPSYELKTAPRAPTRKDHVKTTDIQLIGQDIIYGGPGQVTPYDNNNPVRRKNIEPISWFQNLLQSTLNIIFFPFAQLDWPNPNRRKNDINKTWRDNSKIQLIGQDTFFGAPGQTKVYDYPNPILRKDDVTKRTWIASLVYGISTTIVLAQQAWNWNKNTYSLIFNYNLAQKAWQWVPNSSIIQYAISLVTKAWQWKGQSPIFSGGNFNKVKRVIQAFMVSINRFMNR